MDTFQEYLALIAELHGLAAAGRGREAAAARKKVIAMIREHGLTIGSPAERTRWKRKKPLAKVAGEYRAVATGQA